MQKKSSHIHEQVELIQVAMKKAGVWSKETPEWIRNYREGPILNIWEWLQFIHLPMRINGTLQKPQYLAPIVSPYLKTDSTHQEILQLVIELDSLSPTNEKI